MGKCIGISIPPMGIRIAMVMGTAMTTGMGPTATASLPAGWQRKGGVLHAGLVHG
jgi:hypothetical protein